MKFLIVQELYKYCNDSLGSHMDGWYTGHNGDLVYRLYTKDELCGDE